MNLFFAVITDIKILKKRIYKVNLQREGAPIKIISKRYKNY